MSNDPLFNSSQGNLDEDTPIENAYESLVGEGKKFKDNELLARGKLEADRFIERLKQEKAELLKDLNARISLEDFVKTMKDQTRSNQSLDTSTNDPGNTNNQHHNGEVPKQQEDVLKQVQNLINTTLETHSRQSQQAQNEAAVVSKLQEVWGKGYSNKIAAKAEELGLGKDFLRDLARSNPNAFLKIVGADQVDTSNPNAHSPPTSRLNANSLNQNTSKNHQYYEKLRKENPRHYWTPSVQAEIHKQVAALGPKFYS